HDVERCRLIVVNFRTRLGDALDDRRLAGDVLGDVLNDREGRDDAQRLAIPAARLLRLQAADPSDRNGQEPHETAEQPSRAARRGSACASTALVMRGQTSRWHAVPFSVANDLQLQT